MRSSRRLALSLALIVGSAAPARMSVAQPAQPGAVDGKAHLDAGDRAAKAKDWEKAATEYRAANDAVASAPALEGLAGALYELKRAPEAFEAYDELLRHYADARGIRNRAAAEHRLKELSAQVGTLQVRVAEAGADVSIDGKSIGSSPLPPRHLAVGPHVVRVTKPGFAPFEQTSNIAGGATATVDATLTRESAKGHVVVKEKDGKPMRVVVDGLDVGAAPWEGDLDPGAHEILVRSSQGTSTPQRVDVERGKTKNVELSAVASSAHLTIKTSDPHSILFFDGKPLAEGSYDGDAAPGEHTLVVTRDGFDRFEKKLSLAAHGTETVDVKLVKAGTTPAVGIDSGEPSGRGIYGGFGLAGLGMPGGMGNEIETRCTDLGAASCETPMPAGGGMFGYLGYSFAPIGFELLLGGEFDRSSATGHFTGDAGGRPQNPAATGVARSEVFTFYRAGGLVAARARVNVDWEHVRLSVAGGFGLSYKYAVLSDRTATSTDGHNLKDVYTPKGKSYASPAVTLDASVQWRIAKPTAVSLGLLVWLESASFTDVRAAGDLNRYMGADGQRPAAISTPPYQIASGAQLFLGPYLGMQFGP